MTQYLPYEIQDSSTRLLEQVDSSSHEKVKILG
jgi:hypothetical protein